MKKYYTRACNFYYGTTSQRLIKRKEALPLCGNKNIAFDKIEVFTRVNKKISSKILKLKEIKLQKKKLRNKITIDIKKISLNKNKFNETQIMGILNMTPDSFSDGGEYNNNKAAFKRINSMIKSGAHIIDIGGESTRPGSKTISPSQEWKRISIVVKKFKKKYPKILLSVDTRKSEIMKEVIKNKGDIINDVSGFNYDKKSNNLVKNNKIWKIIHHMQGTPKLCKLTQAINMYY